MLVTALAGVPLAAFALGGLSASAASTTVGADASRIVLGSDCYDEPRTYSVLPDGSGLTAVLARGRPLMPLAVSRNGSTIAYQKRFSGPIYVSRANGAGLHRVVRKGKWPALSRDGRLLAFTKETGIWIVGTNGRGLRRLTSGRYDQASDWSPNGKALLFTPAPAGDVVVQPRHGKRGPELVHARAGEAKWSPDGRWIAYEGYGLTVVRPNGADRHRVGPGVHAFSWSPDGKRLAFVSALSDIAIVGVDGRGLRRVLHSLWATGDVMWSPDARRLAFMEVHGQPPQLWVVDSDGRGVRQLTSACRNALVGWTRLAPLLPAAPPSERLIGGHTVATRDPIAALSADGASVAFFVRSSPTDCEHVTIWTPGDESIRRLGNVLAPRLTPAHPGRCPDSAHSTRASVALAGSRAAWVSYDDEDSEECAFTLKSATLAVPQPLLLTGEGTGTYPECKSGDAYHLRGNGDLLVFNDPFAERLVRIGLGRERCQGAGSSGFGTASICTTLRHGADAAPVDSVSGGLISIRQRKTATVLDEQGKLLRAFTFAPAEIAAARLDGDRLVVARASVIEVYDVTTGVRELSRPLPNSYRFVDVDGGIAVLQSAATVMLLRLADRRSLTLTPGGGPRFADLEPPGLYYSYATGDGGGRLVFMPRAEVLRQIG